MIAALDEFDARFKETDITQDFAKAMGWGPAYAVASVARDLETLLSAELQVVDFYAVTAKKGFDTTVLAEDGVRIFPDDLPTKLPEAIPDAQQAARCLAFDLPTAAAFHIHRVNEAVMRRYWDVVTGGKPHPESRGINAYVEAMKKDKAGDRKVWSSLSDIRKFHRNPVLHPEDQLADIEEALALLGVVVSVITFMLKQIPPPSLELLPSAGPTEATA